MSRVFHSEAYSMVLPWHFVIAMTDLWEDEDEDIRKSAQVLQYQSFFDESKMEKPRNSTFKEAPIVPFKEVSKLQEACNTVGKTRDVLKGPKRIVKTGRETFFPQLECSDQAHRTVSHGQWRSRRDTFPCGQVLGYPSLQWDDSSPSHWKPLAWQLKMATPPPSGCFRQSIQQPKSAYKEITKKERGRSTSGGQLWCHVIVQTNVERMVQSLFEEKINWR